MSNEEFMELINRRDKLRCEISERESEVYHITDKLTSHSLRVGDVVGGGRIVVGFRDEQTCYVIDNSGVGREGDAGFHDCCGMSASVNVFDLIKSEVKI